MQRSMIIVKLGSTFPELIRRQGDFDQWIRRGLKCSDSQSTICDVRAGQPLPDVEHCKGAVLTGAHEMVTDSQAWINNVSQWVSRLIDANTPILGICFGHHLIAHALGAHVGNNPRGMEVGTARIELTQAGCDDPLLGSLPKNFIAQCSHTQSALELPDGAVRLACNAHESNHAFRLGKHIWGVQFHPEFNAEATAYYRWRFRGQTGPDLPVMNTPHSANLLQRFANITQDL